MIIKRAARIWESAEMKDDRPNIGNVLISRINDAPDFMQDIENDHRDRWVKIIEWLNLIPGTNMDLLGIAMATNGYILTVVPVKLDPDDVPGLLHWSVLKMAYGSRGYQDVVIDLSDRTVEDSFGKEQKVIRSNVAGNELYIQRQSFDRPFPNVIGVIHDAIFNPMSMIARFDLDIVAKVKKTAGLKQGNFIMRKEEPAIIYEEDGKGNFRLPFAVVMPMANRSKL